MTETCHPSDFLSRLETDLRTHTVTGQRILVAVSGGADSVALLRGLCSLAGRLQLTCVAAHINHGLRGEHSDRDAAWVAELAGRLGIEFHLAQADLTSPAQLRQSLEEAARNARYELLTGIAVTAQCSILVTGHTADDQTETVLHHLIRGTGLAGLSGMPQCRPLRDGVRLVRPLLNLRRTRIEQWLSEIGQDFRTDASNQDRSFTRNRIRHDLLPLLEDQFNPAFRQVLASLSEQAAETAAFLRQQAETLADSVSESLSAHLLRIDCAPLQTVDPVLLRETLRVVWNRAGWPRKHMGYREWQRLAEVALDGPAISLPGRIDARRRGSLLVLSRPVPDNSGPAGSSRPANRSGTGRPHAQPEEDSNPDDSP